MISVLVVDDQQTIHQTLKTYIEVESDLKIVGFASNGQEALEKVENLNPDIVLMDIDMPVLNGLEATKAISERFVSSKVLMLTMHDEEQYLHKALQMGAKGYLLKTTPAQGLVSAIRYAYQGYFQLGPDLVERYIGHIPKLQFYSTEINELKETLNLQVQNLERITQDADKKKLEQKIQKEVEKILEKEERLFNFQDTKTQIQIDILSQKMRKIERKIAFIYQAFFVYAFVILLVVLGTVYTYNQSLQ
jgi:DNA-binding NarL/FixJ family response regulator